MHTLYLRVILICFFCCAASVAVAAPQKSGAPNSTPPTTGTQDGLVRKTDLLQSKLDVVDANVKEARRDQLNYKIEKDIYKEVYSTQMNTVTVAGSVLLGFAAILGFIGLKDLHEVKLKYQNALSEFQHQSALATKELAVHSAALTKLKADYELVSSKNESQDQQIRLLELLEKGATFFNRKAYEHAAKYFELAVKIEPKHLTANRTLVAALARSERFDEAFVRGEAYLALNPTDSEMRINLVEFKAVSGNPKFTWSKSQESNLQLETYKTGISTYLKVVTSISEKSISATKSAILEDMAEHGDFVGKREFNGWNYEDFETLLSRTTDPKLAQLGREYIAALKGQLPTAQLQSSLAQDIV